MKLRIIVVYLTSHATMESYLRGQPQCYRYKLVDFHVYIYFRVSLEMKERMHY